MICWMRYVQYSAVLESQDLRFIGLGNSKHDEFSRALGFYEQTPRNGQGYKTFIRTNIM